MSANVHRLSARAVQTLKDPGRHADGGNLYLNVSRTGARSWVFMYSRAGRQREMGLGNARDVTLARARELAAGHRQALAEGKDPLALRAAPRALSFGEAADTYIEAMEESWRNPKHRAQWRMTLTHYAAPIRSLGVDTISTEDVLRVLKPIWSSKPETAARLRGRLEAVLDWARVRGMREGENPARWRGHLDHLLPKRSRLARGHHAALPVGDVPAFMLRLQKAEGLAARALELSILTAARSGEVLGAMWAEIDLERAVWSLPAARMKAGREHRIPLSTAAVSVLEKLSSVRGGDYVFPGTKPGGPLSSMAMAMVLRRLKVDVTVHGFRSSFRDWASERTAFSHEVCEMALAHAIASKAEAAYRRGDLFEKRKSLMDSWAQYCCRSQPDNVVLLPKAHSVSA
jgi:integrase